MGNDTPCDSQLVIPVTNMPTHLWWIAWVCEGCLEVVVGSVVEHPVS